MIIRKQLDNLNHKWSKNSKLTTMLCEVCKTTLYFDEYYSIEYSNLDFNSYYNFEDLIEDMLTCEEVQIKRLLE